MSGLGGFGNGDHASTSPAASWAEADTFIDELRKKNGGLTNDQRTRLGREFPDALNVIDNLRRQLGASTQTYVTVLCSGAASPLSNLSFKQPRSQFLRQGYTLCLRTHSKCRGQRISSSKYKVRSSVTQIQSSG